MPDEGLSECIGFSVYSHLPRKWRIYSAFRMVRKEEREMAGWGRGRKNYWIINTFKNLNCEATMLPPVCSGNEGRMPFYVAGHTLFFFYTYCNYQSTWFPAQAFGGHLLNLTWSAVPLCCLNPMYPMWFLCNFTSFYFPAFVVSRGQMKSWSEGIQQKTQHL